MISEDYPHDGGQANRLNLDVDQEKSSYIQNWFAAEQSYSYIQDSDKNSIISETGDSGIGSSFYAPSELGIEDTSGKIKLSTFLLFILKIKGLIGHKKGNLTSIAFLLIMINFF